MVLITPLVANERETVTLFFFFNFLLYFLMSKLVEINIFKFKTDIERYLKKKKKIVVRYNKRVCLLSWIEFSSVIRYYKKYMLRVSATLSSE